MQSARTLLDILATTRTTFEAQARLRNELVEKAKARLKVTEHLEFERFFLKHFDSFNEEERFLHKIIRAYTADTLSAYNRQARDLLVANVRLRRALPRLDELLRHLEVWLAKFNGVFRSSESMCLVYVGVEEKVPFPPGIERDIEVLISSLGQT